MLRIVLIIVFVTLANTGHADDHKLGNDKLKDKGFKRLEGTNKFKPGCRYIIRSEDRQVVYHPTSLSRTDIGLQLEDGWASVNSDDKTVLKGPDKKITVWRNCKKL